MWANAINHASSSSLNFLQASISGAIYRALGYVPPLLPTKIFIELQELKKYDSDFVQLP